MGYCGWFIDWAERDRLLDLLPPAYPNVVADHVTLQHWADSGLCVPAPALADIRVVGIADDGIGVQALVVAVNGAIMRPDGRIFHMTWSIDRAAGRRSVHSNDVIDASGFLPFCYHIPVSLTPKSRI